MCRKLSYFCWICLTASVGAHARKQAWMQTSKCVFIPGRCNWNSFIADWAIAHEYILPVISITSSLQCNSDDTRASICSVVCILDYVHVLQKASSLTIGLWRASLCCQCGCESHLYHKCSIHFSCIKIAIGVACISIFFTPLGWTKNETHTCVLHTSYTTFRTLYRKIYTNISTAL